MCATVMKLIFANGYCRDYVTYNVNLLPTEITEITSGLALSIVARSVAKVPTSLGAIANIFYSRRGFTSGSC
jgi:hypothetical protein